MRLASPVELADAARTVRSDPHLQTRLLRRLLERGSSESAALFFEFALDATDRRVAFAAAKQTAAPPVELLFSILDSPVHEERTAAALVLGWIDGPEIARRLEERAVSGVSTRSALLALAVGGTPSTTAALARCARFPALNGQIRVCLLEAQDLLPTGAHHASLD